MGGIRGNESSVKRHPVCWSQTESGNRGAGIQQTISHQGRARHFVPPHPYFQLSGNPSNDTRGSLLALWHARPAAFYFIFCLQTAPNSRPTSRGKPEPLPWDFGGELQPTCSFVCRRIMCHLSPTLLSISFPILLVSLAWLYISEIYVHPLSLVVLLYHSQVSLFLIL